ncbi:hypothetical protein [Micromonospora sp. NPDC048839]|uniref:hypothetical protein n=1 Tax=Micromonospora sp. NPDC048839 TaxID=3155641 RepID=UPI0033C37CC8
MRIAAKFTAVAGAMVLAALWGSPAQAHPMTAYQGLDKAWISSNHKTIEVQDKECDNHGVYAIVNLTNGTSTSVSDPDGCTGNTGYGSYSVAIASFYVCENAEGCGTTVRVQ